MLTLRSRFSWREREREREREGGREGKKLRTKKLILILNSTIFAPNDQRNLPQESIAYFPLIWLVSGLCGTACAKVLDKKIGSKVSKKAVHLFFFCLHSNGV